jgi:hypothetical protein
MTQQVGASPPRQKPSGRQKQSKRQTAGSGREALRAIAEAMARAGMWEQALRTAEAIEWARERAEALRAIAEAMARAGMTQQALWEQALQTAEAIAKQALRGIAWERAEALRAIAEAMARPE